jgi:hypothetical protein
MEYSPVLGIFDGVICVVQCSPPGNMEQVASFIVKVIIKLGTASLLASRTCRSSNAHSGGDIGLDIRMLSCATAERTEIKRPEAKGNK